MLDSVPSNGPPSSLDVAPAKTPTIRTRYMAPIVAVHLLAALAFVPWLFSWTGVVLAVLGLYVFGTLGINIGYHRLLTHRSFACPRWLQSACATLGACCAQDSPVIWVAFHRRHHQFADDEMDPHSPIASFFWGHVGWLVLKRADLDDFGELVARYARDLLRDPFLAWLDKSDNWIKVAVLSWGVFFVSGYLTAVLMGENALGAIQFGASLLVWGAFVRTVLVWHITWSINSVTHLWGYRNYDTPEGSRNNVLIGLISNGEGWHNNHHADPNSARHGHKWWELDLAWLTIRLLMAVGLAWDVKLPSPNLAGQSRHGRPG